MASLYSRQSLTVGVLASAITLAIAAPKTGAATVDSWNVSSGGSWKLASNWSTGSIPNIAETATIGPIATSVASPAVVTLDAFQTAYALTLDPGSSRAVQLYPGSSMGISLRLLSSDIAPDGVGKFFTVNAASGTGNQINARIQLGAEVQGSFTATINSNDPQFAIRGGITESARSRGVKIVGNGQGIVSFAQTASNYTGDTTIGANGILRLDLIDAIPSGADRGNVVLEGNGQLQFLNATAQRINGLNSTSSTAVVSNLLANTGASLTVGNANANGTYAGSINNSTGSGVFSLTKVGTGTQRLNGTDNYRGTTTVSAGTLLVNGTHSDAGSYIVSPGATLGGTGTINLRPDGRAIPTVTVNAGTLNPGDTGPGVLNINGPLSLGGKGLLQIELGGSFAGNGPTFYDQVNITRPTGSIAASTGLLAVSLVNNFKPKASDVFYILTRADSAAFLTSRSPFDSYPEGATINLGSGLTGKVTYLANWTGNQVTSTLTGGNDMAIYNVVPEPTGLALFSMSAAAPLVLRRCKRG